jgi:DNA-3-methyladenine glycosylase II
MTYSGDENAIADAGHLHNLGPWDYAAVWKFLQTFNAYVKDFDGQRCILWLPYPTSEGIEAVGLPESGPQEIMGNRSVAFSLLQADKDLREADQFLQDHLPPVSLHLYQRHRGLRPPLFVNAFEGIAWTILGQQITSTFAATLKSRVAAAFGTPWRHTHVFPAAEIVAGLQVADLRPLQISAAKSRYLIGFAQAIATGFSLAPLYTMPTAQAAAVLRQWAGIGPWSSEYILLRVFGHLDVIPAGDVALQQHWGALSGLNRKATEPELRHAAEPWHPYQGLFAFSLWIDRRQARDCEV